MPYLVYHTRAQADAACAAATGIWSVMGAYPMHKPHVVKVASCQFALGLGRLDALDLADRSPQFLIGAVEVSPALRDEIMSERDSGRFSPALVRAMGRLVDEAA